MINAVREKCCCVSGHRILESGFDHEKLKDELAGIIAEGYDTFLVGMALGFDTACFHALEELKKTYPVRLIACVPCKNQCKFFSPKIREEYYRMLKVADEVEMLGEEYDERCMTKRNEFMVKHASKLFCYLKRFSGGTFQTYRLAEEYGLNIQLFNEKKSW